MMKLTTALATAAVALIAGLAPAAADGMAKGKGSAPAYAAPECAASKFAGFYAGVHGGLGTMTSSFTIENVISIDRSEDGHAFGGQIGYNWIKCNALFGVEADISMADFDSNRAILGGLLGPFAPTLKRSTDWIGSLRTKSGIAIGDMMIYVTGGLAFASIETSLDVPTLGFNITKIDSSRVGWVAGVGTEYALTDRVRITGDILYYDFGTESAGLNPAIPIPLNVSFDDHNSLWVSRIGLNFKLGDGGYNHAPLK
jgi:outer membrane immunogenic protein